MCVCVGGGGGGGGEQQDWMVCQLCSVKPLCVNLIVTCKRCFSSVDM